jgi:methionyl-tRNA synthetase
MITVQDFRLLDLRVGQICSAGPIKGARRLLKVQVDLGQERRTLVAGLAAHYSPEDLIGLKVIVLANLEPATICGVDSQGMMLGAGCHEGAEIALLTVNKDVPNGTLVE